MKNEFEMQAIDYDIEGPGPDDAVGGIAPPTHPYPEPTDYEMKQAYANQSSIGMVRDAYTAKEAYSNGLKDGLRETDYRDEQRRNQALALAIQYTQGREDASVVVKNAEAFYAFLKGEAS